MYSPTEQLEVNLSWGSYNCINAYIIFTLMEIIMFCLDLIRAQVQLRYGLKTLCVTIVVEIADITAVQMVLE